MTDFSTKATLYVELDDSSLGDARQQIEDELSAEPIKIETEPVDRPGGAGGSSVGRGPNGGGGTLGMLSDPLETQSRALEGITDYWDENIDLNEERNDLLREMQEDIERGNMSGGRSILGTIGAAIGGGLTLGILGASALIKFLKNFSWPKINIPDLPSNIPVNAPKNIPLDAPDSVPLDVPDIPPLEIPEIPPLEVPEIDPLTIKKPDWLPLTLKKPDWLPGGSSEDTGTDTDTGTDSPPTDNTPDDVPDIPPVPQGPRNPFNDGAYGSPDPAPTPPSNDDTPSDSPGSPGIVDRIVTGAATQGAFTLDMLESGADAATDNAPALGGAAGVAGLAKALASRFPAAGGGVALTDEQYRQGEQRTKRFGNWFADQIGMDKPYENPGSSSGNTTASSEKSSSESAKEKAHGSSSIVVEKANNWTVDGKTRMPLASERDYTPPGNSAREKSDQTINVTVKNDVTVDSRKLRSELSGMKDDIANDVEKKIQNSISGVI
jgi:hypothetical protein